MKHYNTKKFTSVLLIILCLLGVTFSAASCTSNTTSTIETVAETTAEVTTEEVTTEEPATEEPTTAVPTTKKPTEKPTQKPTEKPTEPPATLEFTGVSSTVSPGEYAYVSIQGKPNTDYSITVTYKSGTSTADGLYTKTSDGNGDVSWEWKVGTRTSSGTYPIRISGGGQSITEYFTVA